MRIGDGAAGEEGVSIILNFKFRGSAIQNA